ncbi:hypothetical protein NL533_32280, partial [Klebsiella pneumoniae]|nr:hypothetical protein [Klebsiella pneumoniae]
TIDATSDTLLNLIENGYPSHPQQIVGNCAWESTETTLYGILALKRLTKEASSPLSFSKENLKTVQESFQHWLQFVQLEVLENYLKNY